MLTMEAIANGNLSSLYRLYNMYAKKYFPEDMPLAGRDLTIVVSPLQSQKIIGGAYYEGVDANGMTAMDNGTIVIYISPFLLRYDRLTAMTMAHEMVHAYCQWQYLHSKNIKWLDHHGDSFHKVVAGVIGKGLVGIKPTQDTMQLPHSYPVAMGRSLKGGYVFLRFEVSTDITPDILKEFSKQCDTKRPVVIGEMNNSVIGIFPFVEGGKIVGEFFSYGADPIFKMDNPNSLDWPA